ncbi:MAG: hypothetical protein ACYCVL_02410 [Gemmatimonadaceae bacterium]
MLNAPGVGVEIDCHPEPACQRNCFALGFAKMDRQVHSTPNWKPEFGDEHTGEIEQDDRLEREGSFDATRMRRHPWYRIVGDDVVYPLPWC